MFLFADVYLSKKLNLTFLYLVHLNIFWIRQFSFLVFIIHSCVLPDQKKSSIYQAFVNGIIFEIP